jgi:hypothetical protein
MSGPVKCPHCGQEGSWEMRGDVRCYFDLDPVTLKPNGWTTPMETLEFDTRDEPNENGEYPETIYCNHCDSEFSESELLEGA